MKNPIEQTDKNIGTKILKIIKKRLVLVFLVVKLKSEVN